MIKVSKSDKKSRERAEVLLYNLSKLKSEIANIEARYNMKSDYTEICEDAISRLSAIKAERENIISNKNVTTRVPRIQSIIDRIADGIEFGLDNVGDGILYPFDKAVDLYHYILSIKNRK